MGTFQLDSCFEPVGGQSKAIRQVVEGLKAGPSHQTLLGVTDSGKTFSIASMIAQVQCSTLILVPNKTLAVQLYGGFKTFFPHNSVKYLVSCHDYYQPEAYVPSSDTYIEKDPSISDHTEQVRLLATRALSERPDAIIVAIVSSIYSFGDLMSYLKTVLHLGRGDRVDQRELLRRLTNLQYTRNGTDFARVTFRVYDDVIDVSPVGSDLEAICVESSNDEVGGFSAFDPLIGEVIHKLPRSTFYPKSHCMTPRETPLGAINQIKAELKEHPDYLRNSNKLVEAQHLEQRTHFDLEMILELDCRNGIENYSHYLSGRTPGEPPPILYDYLPANSLLIIDESHVSVSQVGMIFKGNRSRKETLVEYGFRLPLAPDSRPLRFERREAVSPQTIFISATLGPYEAEHAGRTIEQVVRPTGLVDPEIEVRPAMTQVDDLFSQIRQWVAKNERVLATTLAKYMAEDLTNYLGGHDVRVCYLYSDIDTVGRMEIIRNLHAGVFDVLVGINLLCEGLDMPKAPPVATLDANKEGLPHSEYSPIQITGCAARNLHGKAIFYADNVTGSMQRAISGAGRRRVKQIAFNQAHGIVPKGMRKDTKGILGGAMMSGVRDERKGVAKMAEESGRYKNELRLSSEISKRIHQLKEKTYQLARDLEFEAAAQLCDEIQTLRERLVNA